MVKRIPWRGAVLDDVGIGRTAFWLVSIPSVLAVLTVLPEDISIPTGLLLWIVVSIVSTGLLGLVLWVSSAIRVRIPVSRGTRPIAVLVTMAAAGAARGVGVVLVFHLFGVDDRTSAAGRIVSSTVIFTVWLVLIGGFLSALSGYRAARQVLLDEIVMRELQMRLFDEGRSAGKRQDAESRMSETTDMVRGILASADVGDAEEYARISLMLHRAIDERIRPLVHEMWFEPNPEFDAPPSTGGFLRKAYLTAVPLTWALGLYAFVETTGALIMLGWRWGVQAAIVEWIACAVVLLAERYLRPKPGILSRSITIAALLTLPLLSAWILLSSRVETNVPFFALLAFVVTAPILTLTCCAARAVLDERGPSLRELQERLERDDWAEQLEMLETRAAENSMASVIHNTVQARLLAAALQLETAAMTNDQTRAQSALDDARMALDSTQSPTQPARSTAERLQSIAEAWKGILDVRISLDAAVQPGPSTRLALDAIEECVANAARHASATVVDVSLGQGADGLELVVSDNGAAFVSHAGGGVGSDWMQRISSGRITRTRSDEGWNQVSLTLPSNPAFPHS